VTPAQFAPGQHDEQEPAAPVIAQVHRSTPLYVHLQDEPEHAASQTSPALSWHVVEQLGTSFVPVPALPKPEHEPPPTGRGMFGHTLSGTLPAGLVTVVDGPLLSRQSVKACCWESHPPTYCAIPMLSQVGCMFSMQRRNAKAGDAHDGVIEIVSAQLVGQLVSSPEEHPACAILSQMSAHAEEISVGVQLSPQVPSGPVSLPGLEVVWPPHPIPDATATRAVPKTMHMLRMFARGSWSRSRP
jgi:hypothetical protein